MFVKVFGFIMALWLAACSPGAPPQAPADTEKAPPPEASTPSSVAPQAAGPESASTPGAAPTFERAPEAATPQTSQQPVPSGAPVASEKPAAEKPAAPEPRFREVTIPAGTPLVVRLSTAVASDTSQVEDEVRGTVIRDIIVAGVTAVPAGTEVVGTVRDAKRSGRVKGRASIAFRFEQLTLGDEAIAMRSALVSRLAAVNRKEDVKKSAIGAGAGAIVGGIVGGGKGAAIGAGVGGAGAVVATRGEEVRLAAGTTVRTTLQRPLKVIVPNGD